MKARAEILKTMVETGLLTRSEALEQLRLLGSN